MHSRGGVVQIELRGLHVVRISVICSDVKAHRFQIVVGYRIASFWASDAFIKGRVPH